MQGRVACLQSLSGTGSLRVGAAFIQAWLPGKKMFISNPTWGNHRNIFSDAGLEWEYYRYFDPETIGLDFEGMKEDIGNAPEGSVIVLHGAARATRAHCVCAALPARRRSCAVRMGCTAPCAVRDWSRPLPPVAVDPCLALAGCAHNPTGVDPTKEQWKEIAEVCQSKGHIPFFDVAYQGFATGSLDQDAWAPRYFVEQGIEVFVSQSYSKNLGLYGERVGAINAVCEDKESATRCAPAPLSVQDPCPSDSARAVSAGVVCRTLSQLKRIARAMYSNPPVHGARIVAEVVNDEGMFGEWKEEMEMMSGRIQGVRRLLHDELSKLNPDRNWDFVTSQIGMFSFTGALTRRPMRGALL